MQVLSERTEIATAINYHKYPVINLDLSHKDEYGYTGTKVNIDCGEEYYLHAEIRTYNDTNRLQFSQGGCGLYETLCYQDYLDMVGWNNAPIVKPDEDILVFIHNSETKEIWNPVLLHTGKSVAKFCITPMTLEEYKIA